MAVQSFLFDELVRLAAGATKLNKAVLYKTWDGWVTNGVLHVTSRSGARTRNIWHFDIEENQGGRLHFTNKSHAAYCYMRSGGQNVLEETALNLSQYCIFDYPTTGINLQMETRGLGCGHCADRYASWFTVVTDGKIEMIQEAGIVGQHVNQYHENCPTGTDKVRVSGGTYAIQLEIIKGYSHPRSIWVVAQEGVDFAHVAEVLVAQVDTRDLMIGSLFANSEEGQAKILQLAKQVADGYPYPDSIREGVWNLIWSRTSIDVVSGAIRDRVEYHLPRSVKNRALIEAIIQQVKDDFRLYGAEGQDNLLVFLPIEEDPNWDTLFGNSGKLRSWQSSYGQSLHSRPRFSEDAVMQALGEWPAWVEERLREACEKSHGCLPHVPNNISLADDAAILVIRNEYEKDHRGNDKVIIQNGRDPNHGFDRVHWNRFWEES